MRILIIDDDPDNLTVLQSILAGAERWNVVIARSADEALRTLETGEVEMVLADIMTPATGGLEICRQIKARRSASIRDVGRDGAGVAHLAGDHSGLRFQDRIE